MSIIRPLFEAQTYRNLLFLVAGIPIAAVVLGLVIAGWTSIAVLAITPLVVPVLLGYRGAVGLVARVDASLARSLLGTTAGPPVSSAGRGFWGRAKAVFLDPSFWRQQAYLLLRMTLGFALAVAELSLIAGALGWISLPIWYHWAGYNFGSWHVDTLGRPCCSCRPGSWRWPPPPGSRACSERSPPGRSGHSSVRGPPPRRPRPSAGTAGGPSGSTAAPPRGSSS